MRRQQKNRTNFILRLVPYRRNNTQMNSNIAVKLGEQFTECCFFHGTGSCVEYESIGSLVAMHMENQSVFPFVVHHIGCSHLPSGKPIFERMKLNQRGKAGQNPRKRVFSLDGQLLK